MRIASFSVSNFLLRSPWRHRHSTATSRCHQWLTIHSMAEDSPVLPESEPTIAPNFGGSVHSSIVASDPHLASEEPGQTIERDTPVRTQLRFSGVYLLASLADGLGAVPNLVLELGEGGVTLSKEDDVTIWTTPWEDVAEIATPERSDLPDGSKGLVCVVTTRQRRSHRFVIASGDPSALEAALFSFAIEHGVRTDVPERSVPAIIAGAVLLATTAVVTLLLLMAGHVIHV